MTSQELFEKLTPWVITTTEGNYRADKGLDVYTSDVFCALIKDAARTNRFQSDVYYSLKEIEEAIEKYDPENLPNPIWIGFRKDGVDGTNFVISACNAEHMYGTLYQRYFALYAITFRTEGVKYGRRHYMVFTKYAV